MASFFADNNSAYMSPYSYSPVANLKKRNPEFLMRAATLVNEDHAWAPRPFAYSQKLWGNASKGRIKIEKIYPSERLAKESKPFDLYQAEVIDMTTTGSTLDQLVWSGYISASCPF